MLKCRILLDYEDNTPFLRCLEQQVDLTCDSPSSSIMNGRVLIFMWPRAKFV